MIRTILERQPELDQYRKTKITRGQTTGFRELDKLWSVKQGTFTIVFSEPTHGKSEFIFEACLNQAERHNKRSLIYSPETGDFNAVVAELFHKQTGYEMIKDSFQSCEDKEYYNHLGALNEKFLVVDSDERALSVQELFDMAAEWEKSNPGQKIDIIVGEPYNELLHDMSNFGGRQDLYIENLMTDIRRLCYARKKHFFLSIHPASSMSVTDVKNKVTYYPKPLPRNAAGGQALYRKAMTWITLWRPAPELVSDSGFPFQKNEVHVFVDKAKPKGTAFKGRCIMFFDWQRNRYYENYGTGKRYAFDHEKPEFQQADIFVPPSPIETQEKMPF